MGEYALEPLAYLITFTTYGTWLHGDDRGSVDRSHNRPGAPVIPGFGERVERVKNLLPYPAFSLTARHRGVVKQTIETVCSHRGWHLHALHVRTNHVHLVVTAPVCPEKVLNALKSWSTRRLRESRLVERRPLWTRHGSTRYLWKSHQVTRACRYVVEGQGLDLPE